MWTTTSCCKIARRASQLTPGLVNDLYRETGGLPSHASRSSKLMTSAHETWCGSSSVMRSSPGTLAKFGVRNLKLWLRCPLSYRRPVYLFVVTATNNNLLACSQWRSIMPNNLCYLRFFIGFSKTDSPQSCACVWFKISASMSFPIFPSRSPLPDARSQHRIVMVSSRLEQVFF